jgi:hypothetical protein
MYRTKEMINSTRNTSVHLKKEHQCRIHAHKYICSELFLGLCEVQL